MEVGAYQADIALDALLWACGFSGKGSEGDSSWREWVLDEVEYSSSEGFSAKELLSLVGKATSELEELGKDCLPDLESSVKNVYITSDYRLFLDPGLKIEMRLSPSLKAVFILFLKHPEGVLFKDLGRYREELGRYFREASPFKDHDREVEILDRILDPSTKRLGIISSKLAQELSCYLDESSLGEFLIRKSSARVKTIPLNRSHVIWDADIKTEYEISPDE